MSLFSKLTQEHLDIAYRVEEIRDAIRRARELREQPDQVQTILTALTPACRALRDSLMQTFEIVQEQLLPRTARVLGNDTEEIDLLWTNHRMLLDALDEILGELPGTPGEPVRAHPTQLIYMQVLFDEFDTLYERHVSLTQQFYQTYSTILFPGGATTD